MTKSVNLCLSRITARYDDLTSTEKALADYIMNSSDEITSDSCATLAEKSGISSATIVRFCRKIGFSGFTEMKMSLSQNWIDQDLGELNIEKEDTTSTITQKVLLFNKRVIDGMVTTLKEDSLNRAADLLMGANRVLVMGDGGSGSSARNAYDVFLQLNMNCEYVTDPFFQVMTIRQLTERDVVVVFSNSGRSKNTIENAKQAAGQGVPVIGVVGLPNSPISKYLDVELLTNIFTTESFCDSVAAQICEISTIAVLHSMIVQRSETEHLYIGDKLTKAYNVKRVDWNER